jgi:hypothetical protein
MNLQERIRTVLKEEVNKKYLKPSEKSEKLILDRLNDMASGVEIYHLKSYDTRHDFEFCKNGKVIMNLALFFEETDDDDIPTSERQFETSTLSIPSNFVDGILGIFPIRKNYLNYIIEEWFEDTFLDKISNMIGRNDISVEELGLSDRSYSCVPPMKKPEGVTQDEMIKVIMNGTLWRKRDLLALEEKEPGSIEDMYLKKLRNNEIERLDSNE